MAGLRSERNRNGIGTRETDGVQANMRPTVRETSLKGIGHPYDELPSTNSGSGSSLDGAPSTI
jgi:hypothetical protein